MKRLFHLILDLEEGIVQDPALLACESKADEIFQAKVTSPNHGFRTKHKDETWLDYRLAFHHYTYSEEIIYDTCDWEIHWLRVGIEDDDLQSMIDLYYAILNHACLKTLEDPDISKQLTSVQPIIVRIMTFSDSTLEDNMNN